MALTTRRSGVRDQESGNSIALAVIGVPTLIAALLYLGALKNGFAYDDVHVILENQWVRDGTALTHAFQLPYWPDGTLYRPLTSFLYAAEWAIGNGSPVLFHLCNLLWYALGTALVARVALRWWSPPAAAAAAILFAVQPVHVEAVANVVGSAELLAGAALLGVALVAANADTKGTTGSDLRGTRTDYRLLGISMLSALALAAKETGVVAPLVAWGAYVTTIGESRGSTATGSDTVSRCVGLTPRALRIFAAAALGVSVPLALRWTVLGTLAGDSPHPAFVVATHVQALALALATIPAALSLLLVPHLPRIDYSPTSAAIAHPSAPLVIGGTVAVVAALGLLLTHARRPSRWTFAALFACATFAPVSNLVLHTGVVLADRTLYGPSVGACLLLGAGLVALWRKALATRPVIVRAPWWGTAGALTCLAAGAAVIVAISDTVRTVPIWRDTVSVFTAMRDRSPQSYRGYYLLGGYYVRGESRRGDGLSRTAQHNYTTAIGLFSGDAGLLYDAGVNAAALGDTVTALRWLRASVDRSPDNLRARTVLVLLDLRTGEPAPARLLLRDGLAMYPDQHVWRKLLDSLDRAGASGCSTCTGTAMHRPDSLAAE